MTWLMTVITTHDGFLGAKSNRRLGKRVIHSDLTEKKLMEVKKVLDIDAMDLDINESHNKSNHVEFQKMGINRDMSTCGTLHSIGSDLTRTWGKSKTHQNGSIRSKQNGLRARDYGNTPTSRAERTHFGLGFMETAQTQMHQNLFHGIWLTIKTFFITSHCSFRKAQRMLEKMGVWIGRNICPLQLICFQKIVKIRWFQLQRG